MNFFVLFSCFALPLWAAMFALYFILCREKLDRESLIAKCGGSFISVASAGIALALQQENPFACTIFWFFVLCTAADALLELSFVPGMLLFGGAHLCLILWLWSIAPPTLWSLLVWALAYGLTAFIFRREIPRLGKALVPFCLYPALLSISLALALPLPFTVSPDLWPLAVGALSFFVSDLMVAWGKLVGPNPKYRKLVMLLYWLALYLISAALWI